MTLYKRGGVWWMNFWIDDRHVQKTTKCTNKRDAAEVERAYRTQLAKGEVGLEPKKPAPFFGAAMADFLSWSKTEHKEKPSTPRRYEVSSKALLRYFGDKPLDAIGKDEVEGFKSWRSKQTKRKPGKQAKQKRVVKKKAAKGEAKKKTAVKDARVIKPATVNRDLACLKAMFNYFIKGGALKTVNPVSLVKFYAENNEQTRVLTKDEEKLYLMAAGQPLQDVATLMLETGARPEEVYRLRLGDVDFGQGFLRITHGKTKAARRKIPLTERAAAVLRRRVAEAEGSYLFPGGRGGCDKDSHVVKLNAEHNEVVTRCGVAAFRLYDLRHTFATHAAESGVDLVTLAALLGHSRLQMVLRYAHPSEEHQANAMKKLAAYRAGKG